MSWQSETRAWAVASAAAFCLAAIGYRALTFRVEIPDLNPTLAGVNAALSTINRPCGGGKPCGTLANVDKLVVKVGDVAVDAQRQVRQSGTLVSAASSSLTGTSEALQAQLSHIGPLLDSARGATDALPVTLAHVQTTVDSLQPVAANANGAVTDLRTLIASPSITATMGNVESVTGSAAAISEDARKVSDKLRSNYLKPVPWYQWPVKRIGEIWDVGAAVARHTP